MNDQLWALSAAQMAAGIHAKEVSSREVVTACLERINATNPALNAITEIMSTSALAAADEADHAVICGEPLGQLHGVPVSIKGNIDLAGSATVNGCAALQNNIAAETSPAAQNWLNAGAIVLGRTNTPEFCVRWETTNDVYGATKNPWDETLSPGGSSGGAAASIAVGMTALAHGTDLGGSLRHPAQACGVASLRPTKGRVPDYVASEPDPAIGYQLMNTDGPIARTIADLRLGLHAMSARDSRDPWWVPAPLSEPEPSTRPIAVMKDPMGLGIDPQVRSGVEKAQSLLSAAGYQTNEDEPETLADAFSVWKSVLFYEIFHGLQPAVKDICGPLMTQTFERYRAATEPVSLEQYHGAFAMRRRVLRDWLGFFQRYSVIIAPVCTLRPQPVNYDIESVEGTKAAIESMRMLVSINALGLPSCVVPVGIANGLPQVVQIIGAPFEEMRCLQVADAIEAQVGAITPIDF